MAVQEAPTTPPRSFAARLETIADNVGQVLHGKDDAIRLALTCLIARGHLLIEDLPGVGKTSLARALAQSLQLEFCRVQSTPDLLPSDVTGTTVFERQTSSFRFQAGPVFTNVLLVDEINRAAPRTQSALLEAMEEHQVTVAGTTHPLPDPFLVIATQNPTDQHGTFPLPESQLDRFLMRLHLGYPDRDAEATMLAGGAVDHAAIEPVADAYDLAQLRAAAASVRVAPALRYYLVDVAEATRHHPDVAIGVSPRGTAALQAASRAMAATRGRSYVTPDDIQTVAPAVLTHRIVARGATGVEADVIGEVLETVPLPLAAA